MIYARGETQKGFTLVELLVVIILIGILGVALIVGINPLLQIQKGQDAKRLSDVKEFTNAAEAYYHDNSCYPDSVALSQTLSQATTWTAASGGGVYLKKVPVDPLGYIYVYKTTAASCPQWGVFFTKLAAPAKNQTYCALSLIKDQPCTPVGYDSSWACSVSGIPDCAELASESIDNVPQVLPTDTPAPTPTPSACIPQNAHYSCVSGVCNNVPMGTGQYCGTQGCSGGACCLGNCQ